MRRGLKRPLHTAKSPGRKRGPAEPAPRPRTTGGGRLPVRFKFCDALTYLQLKFDLFAQ